ncbi:hypothetical protein [Prosthecobacter dejongeii]|uniref:Putative Zn-finger protein n=1 Tax=Prosthecobacter dejongeii TaxID=48465 RepID=A0A7W7YJ21_9BACT|nr:hypothetical protein [Prosthecobacter dejongeii]MBB5037133.1 putative Zn-finger protein [Prosthecobacter dejongeii]
MKIIDGNHAPKIEKPSWLRRLLNRLCFYETMSGAGRCPVYMERWTLALRFGCGIYLHRFIGDDWATDPHDHPRRFISIGLKGWYFEDIYYHPEIYLDRDGPLKGKTVMQETRVHIAPWVRTFPAHHLHRVRASECGDCWTLVIVLPKSRSWGFVQDGQWIGFREYVFGDKARTDC